MNNLEFKNKLENYCQKLIQEKGYTSSVDVLLKFSFLSAKNYNYWRFGKVDCLEKICTINLKKLSTLNKLIKTFAKKLNLKESWTAYNKYGQGKKMRLKFSKSGNENIEKAYATHYVGKKKSEKMHERLTCAFTSSPAGSAASLSSPSATRKRSVR